jgi:sn-glycerol 3-phosphate transport system permease protein
MKKIRTLALDLLLVLLAFLILFPLFYGFFGAFKAPSEFAQQPPTVLPRSFLNLDNFRKVLSQIPLVRYYLNSLAVATLSSVVRIALAVFSAYAFVFYDFPGHKVLFFFMLGTMMMPSDILLLSNYQTVSAMGLIDTYIGMSITSFVGASQMFMLRQHFLTSPAAMHDAALLDGCGDVRFIASILLPTARPILVTLFLQSFLASWNTYLWPLLVTNKMEMRTVQVGLSMITTIEATNYEAILAATVMVMLPTLIVYFVLHRMVSRSMQEGALIS